jgi:hypothetical protein
MGIRELHQQAPGEQNATKVKMLVDQILQLLAELQEDSTKPKYRRTPGSGGSPTYSA